MYSDHQATSDVCEGIYMWYLLSDGKWYHLKAKEYDKAARTMKFVQQLPQDNPNYNWNDEEDNFLRLWISTDHIHANANFGVPLASTDVNRIDHGKVCAGDLKVRSFHK